MNKTLLRWLTAFLAIPWLCVVSAPAQTAAAPQLFGITYLDNQLVSINPVTGAITLRGNINTNLGAYGLAATENGLLYSFSGTSDQIVQLNPTNGYVEKYISIGVTNLQGEGDLAFRGDGLGFLATAFTSLTNLNETNGLYSFDVISGTSQFIGTTPVTIDALAFDSQNTLYALGQDDMNLYIVNQTNGSMTMVGPLGVAMASPFAGMTFSSDGILFAAINDQLYIINTTSGAATAVNTNLPYAGYSSISGLAFAVPQTAPTKLVGVTFNGNQLFSVSTASGAGALIGNLGTNVSAYGLATYLNNLYAFDPNTQDIVLINPVTGGVSNSISIGATNLQGEGDLAIRSDGVGFLSTAFTDTNQVGTNGLYTFDVVNGTSQFLATTPVTIDALAFDSSNTLYALGQDDINLYTVNQTNGTMLVVGPLGVAMASPYAGMTFSPGGVLYAAINDQLYTINKHTGVATVVNATQPYFGFNSVSGLAFVPALPPIPFFNGQQYLGNNDYYLAGTEGNFFGYYSLLYYPYVYHFDLGYEYFIDANTDNHAAYLYDFTSSTFFYTSPALFPYLYDFTLNSWLYYYPNTHQAGHYTTNPRYFYDFGSNKIITK